MDNTTTIIVIDENDNQYFFKGTEEQINTIKWLLRTVESGLRWTSVDNMFKIIDKD